jgi:hypothetical protein
MASQPWPRVTIRTDNGEKQTAIAPCIISASRSTDIPALYGRWLINRIQRGYAVWRNPFNGHAQYVSFVNARLFVFWTKNPEPFFPLLSELDMRGYSYYFLVTCNDYEKENLEPGVPPLDRRIAAFQRLSETLGPERVIWRFDPLIKAETLCPADLLHRMEAIGDAVHGYTRRCIVSFIDVEEYRCVERNMRAAGVRYRPFTQRDIYDIAEGIARLNSRWEYDIFTCAEPCDLEAFGIDHGKCIDDRLIRRLFYSDETLMQFVGDGTHGRENAGGTTTSRSRLKDPGQRPLCGCITSKDIGQYNTCTHLCRYCYANTSESRVLKNRAHRNGDTGESIV